MITTHQDDIIGVQHMMAKQEPLQVTPAQAGIEKALDRSVTAASVGPARQTSHGHPATHGQHRFDHPAQLAEWSGFYALA
jgi:hypothetical protein